MKISRIIAITTLLTVSACATPGSQILAKNLSRAPASDPNSPVVSGHGPEAEAPGASRTTETEARLEKMARMIEAQTVGRGVSFLEVGNDGLHVIEKTPKFEKVTQLNDDLTLYQDDVDYIKEPNGKSHAKEEFFVKKAKDGRTQDLINVINYNGERYVQIWRFSDYGILKQAVSCYYGHGCTSVDANSCKAGKVTENDPFVMGLTLKYAPLFYVKKDLAAKGDDQDAKIAKSFCEFIR